MSDSLKVLLSEDYRAGRNRKQVLDSQDVSKNTGRSRWWQERENGKEQETHT